MSAFDRYEAMSFDCYGTLIDWETGILAHMRPWADAAGIAAEDDGLLQAFGRPENRIQQAKPGTLYSDVLAQSFRTAAEELGAKVSEEAARAFGASVPDWPGFADSAEAL
ncbi:MAG: haloacid dehalogenase, partial [Rhodospirillaceae bacterium]|nr:haloacid dehalogenase [Rhodospirillaceae bacterium]